MALINTTTTGVRGTTLFADGTGDLNVQQNGVTIAKVVNSPAFRAYATSSQSISQGTFTKVNLSAKNFDATNAFDTSTSRFTPNIAGYYQINARLYAAGATNLTRIIGSVRVNGLETTYGRHFDCPMTSTNYWIFSFSEIVYLNGTTDYAEFFMWGTSTGNLTISAGDANTSTMSGLLLKAI